MDSYTEPCMSAKIDGHATQRNATQTPKPTPPFHYTS